MQTLDGIEDGTLEAREQPTDPGQISFAPKILVDDARLDWSHPAVGIDRQVRACTPAPGAWSPHEGERIKVGPITLTDREPLLPGRSRSPRTRCYVGTGSSPVRLGEVKAFGKKQMAAADWARGVRLESGVRLGD